MPRAAEIDGSSGGRVNGVATSAVISKAIAPTALSAHFKVLKLPRTNCLNMVVPHHSVHLRELYITELSATASSIGGDGRNPYLAWKLQKPDSIGRDARDRTPAQRARIHRLGTVLVAEADGGGRLWPCPGARRNLRLPRAAFLRALLFRAEGRERQDRGGDLEGRAFPNAVQAAGGARGHRDRQAHHLSGLVEIPDRHRSHRARRHRRADGAGGRAQEEARRRRPVRRGAQAIAAVAAGSDRHRHVADRRGDSRHPAPAAKTAFRAACWCGR